MTAIGLLPLFLILLVTVLTLALVVGLAYLTIVLISNTLRTVIPTRQILSYFASMIPPSVGRYETANATTAKDIRRSTEKKKLYSTVDQASGLPVEATNSKA